MDRTWPADWESRKQGDSCPFCAAFASMSFFSGRTSEALLERHAISAGHSAVVFRGRHVAELGDLTPEELANYFQDVQHVARVINRAFTPCHLNYLLLGNLVPHLHVHVVPRYLNDSAPGMPLPWAPSPVPADVFGHQFAQLRDLSRESNK